MFLIPLKIDVRNIAPGCAVVPGFGAFFFCLFFSISVNARVRDTFQMRLCLYFKPFMACAVGLVGGTT